ncbi:MAG TPA: hypothetical protein VN176_11630 [Verrucomicrobiae bacterium]|jgi:hypothetical protein|nr:hypothetical protein [Verrucomicrobiae bacterium]
MTNNSQNDPIKRSPWKTKKALAAYLFFLLLLISVVTYIHGVRRVDAQQLNHLIGQRLPAGTDKSTVLEFLDANHISHSEYSREYRRLDANIPKSTVGLISSQIYIVFSFDENGKLVQYEFHELFETL